MSYTIYTPGSSITIPDGTIANTGSTLTLVGKNYAGYGQFLDQNFVNLLTNGVNGGNSNQPSSPLVGQLWWDNTNKIMKVYPAGGSTWKSVGAATSSTTAPAANVSGTGDLWFDSTNQQLKVYNGNAYSLVGPAYSSGQGVTGGIPTTVVDNTGNSHTALEFYSGNTVVAIVSADPSYTPNPSIPGFSAINPGMTMATTVTNAQSATSTAYFWGTATNSLSLGNLPASAYLTSGGSNTANVDVNTITTASDATIGGNAIIDGDTSIGGNASITGDATIGGDLTVTGNTTLSNTEISSLGVGVAATGVTGEIVAIDNITAFYASDAAFKGNVHPIPAALSKVECIGGKTFDWTDEYLKKYGGEDDYFHPKHDFGVIAQDVQAVFPQAVRTRQDGTLAVDYTKLVALSFEAIKELSERLAKLEAKI